MCVQVATLFDPELADVRSVVQNLLVILGKQISMQLRRRPRQDTTALTMYQALADTAPTAWRLERPCAPEIVQLVRDARQYCANEFA
jgi:hypothetical protein